MWPNLETEVTSQNTNVNLRHLHQDMPTMPNENDIQTCKSCSENQHRNNKKQRRCV